MDNWRDWILLTGSCPLHTLKTFLSEHYVKANKCVCRRTVIKVKQANRVEMTQNVLQGNSSTG